MTALVARIRLRLVQPPAQGPRRHLCDQRGRDHAHAPRRRRWLSHLRQV